MSSIVKAVFCVMFVIVGVSSTRRSLFRSRRQLSQEIQAHDVNNESSENNDFTNADLDALVLVIREHIENNPQLIPNWVQLSFHDCFGQSGCNGCLDLNHSGNGGLLGTIDGVVDLHQEIGSKLSLADFIALLGTQAAKAGAEAAGGSLHLPFSIGRKDCNVTQHDEGLPLGDQTDTISLLRNQFDLSIEEAVALMGAHSLGRAKIENTGFSGPWDRTELKLDSGYYRAMMSTRWEVERVNNSQIQSSQWILDNGVERFMMLHADMILRKKFLTSGEFNEPSCTILTCSDQEITADMVRQFGDQAEIFHEVFSRAFLKMITKTCSELTPLE